MYCPNCKEEYDGRFCPECGTKLINKPADDGSPRINLGDGNAINGSLNVTDARNIHTEDNSVHNITTNNKTFNKTVNNINNTTVNDHSVTTVNNTTNITNVAAKKTKMELLQERRTKYLNACKRAYEDSVIEESEMLELDSLRIELGLDEDTANELRNQVSQLVQRNNAQKTELTDVAKNKLKQLSAALKKNETSTIIRQIDELEALADKFANEELRRKYYLVLAALKPEKCIQKHEDSKIDNYWLDFWSCLAYLKMGDANKATKIMLQLEDKYPTFPADNVTLLSVACAYIRRNEAEARVQLTNLNDEYTPALQRFVESLYVLLEPDMAHETGATRQTCAFYLINIFNKDFAAEEQERRRAEEEAKRRAKEEAERERKAASQKKMIVIGACLAVVLAAVGIGASISKGNKVVTWASAADDAYYGHNGVEQSYTEALSLYRKAANAGNANAQAGVGDCYYYGYGVEKDYTEAEKWYRAAAEQGDARGQYGLCQCYRLGRGIEQSYTEAVKWCSKAAEQGHAKAQYRLGYFYYYNQGVDKDYDEAVKWYRKAAAQGITTAKRRLGDCYSEGKGVVKDEAEALKWYKEAMDEYLKAAEAGDAEAHYHLGNFYDAAWGVEKNEAEALKWWRKGAELGDNSAMGNLGCFYTQGKGGVKQSYTEALKWFRKAAELGDSYAQNWIGTIYANGYEVEQSYFEAAKWYRKAAEQGDDIAQDNLANLYYDGNGVEQNYTEAMKWYFKAAEQGNVHAQFRLGYMFSHHQGSHPFYGEHAGRETPSTESLKWYRKAAEQGHTGAMNNIGAAYANEQDYAKAAEWYRKAAELGDDYAQCNLGDLHYEGLGVEKSEELAIQWWRKSAAQGHVLAINNLKKLGLK